MISGRITRNTNPVSGAPNLQIQLQNTNTSQFTNTMTDPNGNYNLNVQAGYAYRIMPAPSGYAAIAPLFRDVTYLNGNVNAQDFAATVLTYTIGGQITANGSGLTGVMVGNSCAANAVQTDASGNYSFPGLNAGSNCVVTPSLANYTFTPTNQTFNNLSANQTANFTSASNCTYSISPTGASLPGAASTGNSITVTTQVGCQWSAASSDNWITVLNGTSRTDSGTLNYSVTANNSGASRTGSITIAGQTFTVTQNSTGASLKVCKIAGSGVSEGSLFNFDVTGTDNDTGTQITRRVPVIAGSAQQGGGCRFVPISDSSGNSQACSQSVQRF